MSGSVKSFEIEMRSSFLQDSEKCKSFTSNLENLGRFCVSIGFVYSAYLSIISMITGIFDELGYAHLGRICMILIHSSAIIGNFIVPYELKNNDIKYNLIKGTLQFTVFYFSCFLFLLFNYYEMKKLEKLMVFILIISSVICG